MPESSKKRGPTERASVALHRNCRAARDDPGQAASARPYGLGVVSHLAVGTDIEPGVFGLFRRPQTDNGIDDLVENGRDDTAPDDGDEHGHDLGPDLACHSDTFGIADAAERRGGKDAGADGAD